MRRISVLALLRRLLGIESPSLLHLEKSLRDFERCVRDLRLAQRSRTQQGEIGQHCPPCPVCRSEREAQGNIFAGYYIMRCPRCYLKSEYDEHFGNRTFMTGWVFASSGDAVDMEYFAGHAEHILVSRRGDMAMRYWSRFTRVIT